MFGHRCAMVWYEFLDGEPICESNIGISVADATDSTKSGSYLVLTEHGLMSLSSAVQSSLEICQMMKGCMVYAVFIYCPIFCCPSYFTSMESGVTCFAVLVTAAYTHIFKVRHVTTLACHDVH